MLVILFIYLLIGSVSAVTNFFKSISPIGFILFFPFMLINYLIFGTKEKKKEAIIISKGLLVVCILYFVMVEFIICLKN